MSNNGTTLTAAEQAKIRALIKSTGNLTAAALKLEISPHSLRSAIVGMGARLGTVELVRTRLAKVLDGGQT